MGVAEDFAPSFTQKPQLRQEDEGNRLVFECKIMSAPKPDITWFRSDTQLSENNRTFMKTQTVGTNLFLVVLELDDVVESDAGLYKVKAKNKMGEVAASINLNFSPVDEPRDKQIDGLAPTFSKKPAIRQEDDGKRLLFECRIQADPTPSVVWSHGGNAVKDDARHKMKVDKDGHSYFATLEIKNVTIEDAGKYKVTAKNELGESNATISLNFDSGEDGAGFAPSFIEKPKIIPNETGTLITMRCKCTAKPKPVVTWGVHIYTKVCDLDVELRKFNASTPRYPQPPLRKLSKRPTDTPGLDSSKPYPASQPSYPASQPSYPASQPSYPPFDNSQQFQPYDNYPQNQPYAPGPPYGGYPGGTGPPGMAPPFNPGMGQAPPQPGMTMPTQLFSDPLVANVAMSYGSKIMGSGKEYVDREIEKYVPVSRLKYYFAVDTSYVLRKLKLLFFPFTHTDWSVKYEHNEPVQPRYEVNAPDLYIPTMAYVTYVLVAGLALGTQNRFAPEVLGMLASSALAWSVVEILVALVTLYITNTNTKLKTFDLIAFAGYKYVGIIVAVLLSLVANKTGYYLGLIYCGFSLAFFTMRSLKWQVLAEVTNTADAYSYAAQGNKRRLYFLLFMACLQPVLMWWLSAHLVPPPLPPAPPNMLQS